MPECQNCGEIVTETYARVFTPDSVDEPRACPFCPDKIRDRDGIRDARSKRRSGNADFRDGEQYARGDD